MSFLIAAQTDIGTTKNTNQDSYTVKSANTAQYGPVLLGVVCDGMGGLSKGELASATVVKAFSDWFDHSFALLLQNNQVSFSTIKNEWDKLVKALNSKIGNYGIENGFSLGTTLVAVLCVQNKLFVINVGDSRLYKISSSVVRLTRDQSLVAQEIANGKLAPEAEETDSRRNVLLQCVGASNVVVPEFQEYTAEPGVIYLLCSDGFRHKIKEEELLGLLSPRIISDESFLSATLEDIISLLKQRDETDNITAVAFKIC